MTLNLLAFNVVVGKVHKHNKKLKPKQKQREEERLKINTHMILKKYN